PPDGSATQPFSRGRVEPGACNSLAVYAVYDALLRSTASALRASGSKSDPQQRESIDARAVHWTPGTDPLRRMLERVMSTRFVRALTTSFLFVDAGIAVVLPGCGTSPFGASIDATQQFDQPNFTVQFALSGVNSANVTSVNWVFGDGPGFTTGGTTITHQYS